MKKDQDLTAKPQANPHSPDDQEEAEKFRRMLQSSDEVAPVDDTSYGKRAAEIILRGMMAYWRKN